ncbi:hypothetical protein MRB53_002832 [Persea americana]|uniref:Uncharacterized protein n=1 Tax=Persea americana TaxID=3435 RepID=A0ACC2MVV1_PERAE|nr:hypothetical protein MRB53_002832 [Persea americana]
MRKRVYMQRGERCRGSNGREGPSKGSEREQRKLDNGVGRSLYQPINDLARLVAHKPILKIIKLDGSRYRKTNTTISQPYGKPNQRFSSFGHGTAAQSAAPSFSGDTQRQRQKLRRRPAVLCSVCPELRSAPYSSDQRPVPSSDQRRRHVAAAILRRQERQQ